jgi:hypothetical protein
MSLSNADTLHADADRLIEDGLGLTGGDPEDDQSDAQKQQKNGCDILFDQKMLLHKGFSKEVSLQKIADYRTPVSK